MPSMTLIERIRAMAYGALAAIIWIAGAVIAHAKNADGVLILGALALPAFFVGILYPKWASRSHREHKPEFERKLRAHIGLSFMIMMLLFFAFEDKIHALIL